MHLPVLAGLHGFDIPLFACRGIHQAEIEVGTPLCIQYGILGRAEGGKIHRLAQLNRPVLVDSAEIPGCQCMPCQNGTGSYGPVRQLLARFQHQISRFYHTVIGTAAVDGSAVCHKCHLDRRACIAVNGGLVLTDVPQPDYGKHQKCHQQNKQNGQNNDLFGSADYSHASLRPLSAETAEIGATSCRADSAISISEKKLRFSDP